MGSWVPNIIKVSSYSELLSSDSDSLTDDVHAKIVHRLLLPYRNICNSAHKVYVLTQLFLSTKVKHCQARLIYTELSVCYLVVHKIERVFQTV